MDLKLFGNKPVSNNYERDEVKWNVLEVGSYCRRESEGQRGRGPNVAGRDAVAERQVTVRETVATTRSGD
uniref:Protein kinase domain-containing protein n=1 Tax=Heterorhabditis bacteriophora TaxID=37862 RepID=A0A1I7WCW1_HETBA